MQITDEMVEAAAKIVCAWLNTSWDGLSDRDISDKFPDWAYPVYGPSLQGGKPALRKIMRAALEAALWAQRQGAIPGVVTNLHEAAALCRIHKNHQTASVIHQAAACIEDLAAALKPFASVDWGYGGVLNTEDYNRARAVRERWGLK